MRRKLLVAVLALLCLCSIVSAFNRGSASAWYFKSEFALNAWADAGKIDNKQEYIDTVAAITTAHQLDPSHPHYVHMLGRITHWGVSQGLEPFTKLPHIKQWYIEATELRPMWPDPWIDLARLNNFTDGYNSETKHFMHQALTNGPYIDDVNTGVIRLLLQHWAILETDDRDLLFEQFKITTWQPKVLRQVMSDAQSLGREKLLCTQLRFNPSYSNKYKDSRLYRQFCTNA